MWFVIMTLFCFMIRNPSGYDLWHYWLNPAHEISGRVLVGIIVLAFIGLVIYETHSSFGHIGLAFLAGIIGVGFWFLYEHGMFSANSLNYITYWGPIVMAFIMTIGFQGGRIYRSATSRQPISGGHHATDIYVDTGHHDQ
jgi:hypothetical protein